MKAFIPNNKFGKHYVSMITATSEIILCAKHFIMHYLFEILSEFCEAEVYQHVYRREE
jgi:hypothetical protein